jgi:gamma-butyrobetaine dioxygenase
MTQHGLQAAHFARAADAPEPLVLAALLHDIGHLIEAVPDRIEDWQHDAAHEDSGSRWLERYFGPEVCGPVRLHVAAKRCLCATDPQYIQQLSPASVLTLKLQGGPMSADEVAAFQQQRGWREALRLRRWDDAGKVAGLTTVDLEAYRPMIERQARGGEHG